MGGRLLGVYVEVSFLGKKSKAEESKWVNMTKRVDGVLLNKCLKQVNSWTSECCERWEYTINSIYSTSSFYELR